MTRGAGRAGEVLGRVGHCPPLLVAETATSEAFERLAQIAAQWHQVEPTDPIRETAVRFLRVHPLRAADAFQLAAASAAAERRPSTLEVVTLDDRLAAAARREGFVVVEVPSGEAR